MLFRVAVPCFWACLSKTTKWALCPISTCHFAGQVARFAAFIGFCDTMAGL